MKAYIFCESPLGENWSEEGMYAIATEDKTIFRRWCTNRGFANHDLTIGIQNQLIENGITSVYSNGMLVWIEGKMTLDSEVLFRMVNYEYERKNSNALSY